MAADILIVDYDNRWPERYSREAERIRAALGERVLALEHTGSTSVSALAAKPIIDILLVVEDSADEAAYVPALESAGYRLRIREPDWHEHRMFKGPDADVNLHVFSRDCPEVARILRFRDWLRSHPADRELYGRAKQTLAGQAWPTVDDYARAKTEVIEEILRRAESGE